MAKGVTRENLIALAREGAQARIRALRAELASLESMFGGGAKRGRKGRKAGALKPRKRRKMSAAARKRISEAQKRRWAKQKAGEKK